MDRYFYSVEMDGDQKVVHMFGNVYFNDADETDKCFRCAEWAWLYMTIAELKARIENRDDIFDYLCQKVAYMSDLTEAEAIATCQEYFDGTSGIELDIRLVDEDTPCGDYWME